MKRIQSYMNFKGQEHHIADQSVGKTAKRNQEDQQQKHQERPGSRGSMSRFTETEPAEQNQQDDNDDELMIVLDTKHTVLEKEEPVLSQEKDQVVVIHKGHQAFLNVSISKNRETLRKMGGN